MSQVKSVGEGGNPGSPDELSARLARLASGGPGLAAALVGPVGTGKTHAARALLQAAPVRGVVVRADQPLAELAQALLHGAAPRWVRTALERLARREALAGDELPLALTAALTTAAPLIVLVEDLHGAAAPRRTLWTLLASGVRRSSGVALLATSLEPAPPFETFEVPPLSRAEVRALVAGHHVAVPEAAAQWIEARAGGNPLFALEYALLLARRGFLRSDGPRPAWSAPPPGTVPQNLVSRIEHALTRAALSPEATRALRALAVLPAAATGDEVARCAGLAPSAWEAALRDLALGGLVRGGRVVHPLYTLVILRRLPPDELLALVRRAAEVLRDRPEVAAQLLEAHPLPPAEALDLLTRAACHARGRGDDRGASAYTARSVPLLTGRARVEAALEAARGLRPGDPREALRLARDAHTGAPDHPEAGPLLAELLIAQNHVEQALEVIGTLPGGAGEMRAHLRALAFAASGDFGEVLREWRAAPPRTRRHPALRVCAAWALVNLGRVEGALSLLPPPGAGAAQEPAALLVRALAHEGRGESAAALERTDEALARLRPSGPGRELAEALLLRARLRWGQVDPRPALADADEAARVAESLANGFLHARARASRAVPLLEGGEYEAAEEALQDGLAAADLAERGEGLRETCRAHLAFLYAEWGWVTGIPRAAGLSLAYAGQLLSRAEDGENPVRDAWHALIAAHAHARHGDPRRALALAQGAIRLAQPPGQERGVALAEVALGVAHVRLGRSGDAERWLDLGVGHLARLGLPGWAERYALELDAVRGNAARARERLGSPGEHGHAVRVARRLFPDAEVTDAPPATAPATRLLVLGPFALETGRGRQPFSARRGQTLLALLLEARLAGHAGATQHDLLDLLYPGQDDTQAVNALQQLVRRVRRTLGPGAVARTAQGYALGDVASDVEEYLQTHDLRLWRGAYLEDVGEGSSPGVRERLDRQLREDLDRHAARDPDLAVRILGFLLRGDPYNHGHLHFTLETLRRLDRIRTAREVYAAARARFAELDEPLPDDWEAYLAGVPPQARRTAP
ncbi:tetratricopeptide repeat protein [Deinococcus aestuarii]|uniref:tetratricopeptide repeat protein n=1 Tax=Deinococcus aestuarii TaxID=2774531 RepID=UPI001C0B4C38|nr:tetratricopeptide repeat protein [Deinococcus aestuarii]